MPTILVVENHDAIRNILISMLQLWGYTTLSASDGLEGVRRAYLRQPDLILMDLNMPVLSGHAAVSLMKKHPETASIPVIVLSTADQPDDRARSAALGCVGHLSKPIDFDVLQRLIESIVPRVRS